MTKPHSLIESRKKDLGLDLSDTDLKRMYTAMVRVRKMDEKLVLLQRQGRIGFYLECRGQEAAHIGAAYALEPEDWLYPHYRDQGIPLLRGISVQEMVHQIFGNAKDNIKGRQMPVHYSFKEINYVSISSPLGVQIVQAAGTALAMKMKGSKNVVMTSFGDGSSSEIDFHSGMNLAAVTNAPCIFLLENNQFAISVPVSRQSASETFAMKAEAYGMPGVRVDGNDVLAMYQATKEAVARARAGEGPTLIEAVTFRMGAHSTSDDPSRYCPPEMFAEWSKKDPIERFEKYLLKNDIINPNFIEKTGKDAETEITNAIKEAEAADPYPPVDTMFSDVYEDLPQILKNQQAQMMQDYKEHGIPGGH